MANPSSMLIAYLAYLKPVSTLKNDSLDLPYPKVNSSIIYPYVSK